jgi:ferritin-like metal-binding protein YciE
MRTRHSSSIPQQRLERNHRATSDCLRKVRAQLLLAPGAFDATHHNFRKEFHTMPSLDSLELLLHDELKDVYDAEKQLLKALPKLAKKAGATELKSAFEEHLRQTERHVERLEEAFEQLGMPARGKKCEGMQHLISEGEEMIGEAEEGAVRDAIMIASAQKVEHYEVACYGTLRTWANLLGKPEVAALMEETLEEEKETVLNLTSIAEDFINEAAAEGDEEETDRRRTEALPAAAGVGSSRTVDGSR